MKKNTISIEEILGRGVDQVLPSKKGLTKLMNEKKITLYLGIDPTGAVLHLGHSVVLRKLQQFASMGHNVILLIGNGTVKIGDPTGRDTTRPVLTSDQIEKNFKNWKKQASKILDFSKITIKRNGDWLDKLTMPEMVRLLAKTTIQQLLERDMFQERMKKNLPIFGHEVLYPMLQGYDSVVMDVDLEIGGTDQTFNMMMGRNLQKIYNQREKWVLTTPLINGTDGRKMSKSYNNYVALTASANDIYGKIMSLKDELIIEYFTLLTDLDFDEVKKMNSAMKSGENPMSYKKRLAFTITKDLHDKEAAEKAQKHFEKTVQQGQTPDQLKEVEVKEKIMSLLDLLKLCLPDESSSNIKRLIQQKAIELVDQKKILTNPFEEINIKGNSVIRVGKRNYFKLIQV